MSFVFEKVTVKKWEVTKVYKNFMQTDIAKAFEDVPDTCEICAGKLDGEYIHMAYVKGRKNHLICDDCCEQAVGHGVEVIRKKDEERPLPKFD